MLCRVHVHKGQFQPLVLIRVGLVRNLGLGKTTRQLLTSRIPRPPVPQTIVLILVEELLESDLVTAVSRDSDGAREPLRTASTPSELSQCKRCVIVEKLERERVLVNTQFDGESALGRHGVDLKHIAECLQWYDKARVGCGQLILEQRDALV